MELALRCLCFDMWSEHDILLLGEKILKEEYYE